MNRVNHHYNYNYHFRKNSFIWFLFLFLFVLPLFHTYHHDGTIRTKFSPITTSNDNNSDYSNVVAVDDNDDLEIVTNFPSSKLTENIFFNNDFANKIVMTENSNDNNNEKLYTYDEIVGEMEKVTEEFYNELIHIRNMLPSPPPLSMTTATNNDGDEENDEDIVEPARRRRRSIHSDDYFVPDFIRDGIQLISEIVPIDDDGGVEDQNNVDGDPKGQRQNERPIKRLQTICSKKGFIIDFVLVKFNHNQYIVCLIKEANSDSQKHQQTMKMSTTENITDSIQQNKLFFGAIDNNDKKMDNVNELKSTAIMHEYTLFDMIRPKKILAFVDKRRSPLSSTNDEEILVIILVNEKRTINEQNIKWIQVDSNNKIIYQNHLASLKRISTTNVAIWEKRHLIIVHDIFEGVLKLFKFVGTYFDHVEFVWPVTNDLNAIYAFTLSGISYLALGYGHDSNSQMPKDVSILRYNDYMERLELIQSIQCSEKVIGIEYFNIGHGINQENFLAIIEVNHIVMYKFLKSKHEFIVFQRISSGPIRYVNAYGDVNRMFVMAIILQSNDIYFVTYNSLRFIYSPINIRVYVNPMQPIYLKRIFNSNRLEQYQSNSDDEKVSPSNSVYLMIGAMNGIRLYSIRFFHDNNLFKLWTDHLNWCHIKRNEIADLEKHSTRIEKRFHESYFKSDPLIIRGTLAVPEHYGTIVETDNYRHVNNAFTLNSEYFNELSSMKRQLISIEKEIQKGHELLTSNAVFINSAQVQIIIGNFSFYSLSIMKYDGNHIISSVSNHHQLYSVIPSMIELPTTMNIITDYLNGKMIRDLYFEIIKIRLSDYSNNNLQLQINEPMFFDYIDQVNSSIWLNALINERYNATNIVTVNGNHMITGHKSFYRTLIVDDLINAQFVNGKRFDSENVLLTIGEQRILNSVHVVSQKLRSGQINAINVNGMDFDSFLHSIIRIDQPFSLTMPIEFANKLIVNDLIIESGGRLNELDIEEIYDQALWLNKPNQTITGDCYFQYNLSILANLNVRRINNRNIPDDFIRTDQFETIVGHKIFNDQVYIQNLNISKTLNGLALIDDMPDIVINDDDVEQNITGKKILHNLSIRGNNNSYIGGLLNGMNIGELEQRSRRRPSISYIDTLHIENIARFEGGLWFESINSITKQQFHKLVEESLTLDDQWSNLALEHVHFDRLHVNYLDCNTINGIDLANDLLTRTTPQMINLAQYSFSDIEFHGYTRIDRLNNYSMTIMLDNVLKNSGDQLVNGTKEIHGDVHVQSLIIDSYINDIPIDDIVFNNDVENYGQTSKWINGIKQFNNQRNSIIFNSLIIGDLIVDSINDINMNEIINYSIRRREWQNISKEFRFKSLVIAPNEEFTSPSINGIPVKWLENDIVTAHPTAKQWQNISAPKYFIGQVSFDQIEFDHLFDDITVYEMQYNWLIKGHGWWSSQPRHLQANFSIDHLTVQNVYIHNGHLNNIDLNRLFDEVVWLDRKTSILSEIEFFGNVKVMGDILLNGRLNEIDLRQDVVLSSNYTGAQKIKGNIHFVNNVTVMKDLNVKGLINKIDIDYFCGQVYKPSYETAKPLVINGNVDFWAPVQFELINGLSYDDLNVRALRHDYNGQKIIGKKMIDILVLNGPTIVNGYINDLKLDYIFDHYMSVTRDQEVQTNLVLRNVRFEDDVQVNNLQSDTDIINGVDLGRINHYALRQYGDQTYGGNIHFDTEIIIDKHLNAKWINEIVTDQLMHKKRSINTFTEEIEFTQDLNVNHSMTVMKGRKISNINIDRFLNDAVLAQSDKNYTIYGMKTFDNVDVHILHTRPLNNVTISRENLLLKSFDQTVHGRTILSGDVLINTTFLVEKINDIKLNDLKHRLVKKNSDNIIKTKVRVNELFVNNVDVQSFIDNVNITILNHFTNTTNYLRQMDHDVRQARLHLDSVRQNLQVIGSKLLYFDRLYEIDLDKDLNLIHDDHPSMPLSITMLSNSWICIFQSSVFSLNSLSICNQIDVYCNYNNQTVNIWKRHHTFYYPGTLLAFEQIDNVWLLFSYLKNSFHKTYLLECLRLNDISTYTNSSYDSNNGDGIWFQSLRFFSQTNTFQQNHHHLMPLKVSLFANDNHQQYRKQNPIMDQMILALDQTPSYAILANDDILNILHIGHMNRIEIYPIKDGQYRMYGRIQSIYRWQNLLLVSINHPYESRLEILTVEADFKMQALDTIVNVCPEHMVIMANRQISDYKNFIIFNNILNFELLYVFGTTDGVRYVKVQEIHTGRIKNLALYSNHYTQQDSSDLLMVHLCDQIRFYRLFGLDGFRQELEISISNVVNHVGFSQQPNWYLFIYHDHIPVKRKLEILNPIYRNNRASHVFYGRYHRNQSTVTTIF